MELAQPLQSSATRFLVPSQGNKAFVPDVIRALQERYRFWRVPQSMEEYSQASGAEFLTGIFDGQPVAALRVYSNGVKAEATAKTSALDAFLDDAHGYVQSTFGLWYEPMQPVERIYSSAVEVTSTARLGHKFAELDGLMERLTLMVASYGVSLSTYQVASIAMHSDPTASKPFPAGRFIFERRANTPFTGNVFYSEAPVSTDQHMELLGMLEAILTTV